MTTQYQYPLSSILGVTVAAQFTPQMSDHLANIIRSSISAAGGPSPSNPLQDLFVDPNDATKFDVLFASDLSNGDKTTLDGLIPRTSEYFIITTDGGNTDLGDGATVAKPAGSLSSATITLQMMNGDATKSNGHGEAVALDPTGVININTSGVPMNGSGQSAFVVGAELTRRGRAPIGIHVDGFTDVYQTPAVGSKIVNAQWT